MKTFSMHALAELTERDRGTISRAMRDVPPDAIEKNGIKRKCWTMKHALAALDRLPGSHNAKHHREVVGIAINHDWTSPDNWRSTLVGEALVTYNELFSEMRAIPDLKKRRAFAIAKLAPLIISHSETFTKWETDNPAPGRFDNSSYCVLERTSLLWGQELEAASAACEWDHDEGRQQLYWQFIKDTDAD